jgi:hypothetical protein
MCFDVQMCRCISMCGCADFKCSTVFRCADVQMCRCVSMYRCFDVQMCRCAEVFRCADFKCVRSFFDTRMCRFWMCNHLDILRTASLLIAVNVFKVHVVDITYCNNGFQPVEHKQALIGCHRHGTPNIALSSPHLISKQIRTSKRICTFEICTFAHRNTSAHLKSAHRNASAHRNDTIISF